MEKRDYLNIYFDYYQSLLTLKEVECFKSYYDDDFSLGEIALENEVSRSAVHKTIKNVEEKLYSFEEKLGLFKKYNEVIKILDGKINDELLEEIKNII